MDFTDLLEFSYYSSITGITIEYRVPKYFLFPKSSKK